MAKITAISSLTWSNYTLYEILPRIADRGFKRIDIASFYRADTVHFNFGSPTPAELNKMLKDLDLTPICLNWHCGNFEPWDPKEIDIFVERNTRKLKQLPEVGIPMMTMTFGRRNERQDQEAQLWNCVKAYDRVAEIAEQYGVQMVVELPHVYMVPYTAEKACWVFEHVTNDKIGLVIDSSHWGIVGYNLEEYLDKLGDRLAHVHLRDAQGVDTADFKQDLILTPGKGKVDFKRFGKALDDIGYNGDITAEFEYRDLTFEQIEDEIDFGFKYLVDCGWQIPEGVKIS